MSKFQKYDLAILFDCVNSSSENIALIPKMVIEGKHICLEENEEISMFITKDENIYPSVEEAYLEEYNQCFGFPINLETEIQGKTLKMFSENDKNELMSLYLDDIFHFSYSIGFNLNEDKLVTYKIDLDKSEISNIDINKDLYSSLANEIIITKKINNNFKDINSIKVSNSYKINSINEIEPLYVHENKKQQIELPIKLDKVFKDITKHVLFQDEPIKKILTAVYKNQLIDDPKLKTNILLAGPTGVGKTEIMRLLAKNLKLPITIEDATQYTISGYVGKSTDEMLFHLYEAADRNIELAQKGILVIDEIDKKASPVGQKDTVAGVGVLYSLLKLMEDGNYVLNTSRGSINFNTSKLTIIVAGAFSEIKDIKERTIGFNQNINNDNQIDFNNENLINFGMPPEFIGRCQSKVFLNPLGPLELKEILKKSKSSNLVLNRKFFNTQGIALTYNKALDEIATRAHKLGTGARSLNSIVDETLSEATYDILVNPNKYQKLIITKDTVTNPKIYKLIKK